MGSDSNPGLINRFYTSLFDTIEDEVLAGTAKLEVSFLEVYLEQVTQMCRVFA